MELETTHPFPFDRACGRCLTQQEVDFHRITGGLIMAHDKEINGVFTYNGDSKKFKKFIFQAAEGVVGNIYMPKDIQLIPTQIILKSAIEEK